MRVFLTFFLKKREDIIKKIEDLGSLKPQEQPQPIVPETILFEQRLIPDFAAATQAKPQNQDPKLRLSQLMFLRIMCEIYLFHSLVILLNQPLEPTSAEQTVLRNELTQLLESEHHLPIEFCREVLFAYDMHDEALSMLMQQKAYGDLLRLLRQEVDKAMAAAKRDPAKKAARQMWIRKLVKYSRRINGMCYIALISYRGDKQRKRSAGRGSVAVPTGPHRGHRVPQEASQGHYPSIYERACS